MMASGEIHLLPTMARLMPVLAQGQDPSAESGGTAQNQSTDASGITPNTGAPAASPDPTQPGLGLNANNFSQAAYFPNNVVPTSESVAGGVVTDILGDLGSISILIVCPECEAAALIVEIGANLLGAADAYYGARGNLGPTGGNSNGN